MFNKLLFKAKVISKNKSLSDVALYLGINYATLHRKMCGESDFYREEIQKLCDFLVMNEEERTEIFFAKKIT